MSRKFWLGIFSVFGAINTTADGFGRGIDSYDICIYGGSSAGVVAAYSASKSGKTVLLIAPDGHIGGLSSGGLGQTDIGNKHVVTGVARDFYRRLGRQYNKLEAWQFEPGKAEAVFREYLREGKIAVLYHKRISDVIKHGDVIEAVDVVDTYGAVDEKKRIHARVFLDCTYEGDLMAMAGVSYTVGREDNSLYKEKWNGYYLPRYREASGYHQFPDGISPYRVPEDPSSGLVWGIGKGTGRRTGTGDRHVQAYNFRICLTDSAENRIPVTRPPDYDSSRYELLARLLAAQPEMRNINHYFIWSLMPGRKTDVNNRGAFSTDMIGMSDEWPEADFEKRREIFNAHLSYIKGLLYFMSSDPRVPDTLRNFVSEWGYPKDEYLQHGNFTPQLYVREGRRMIGEYVMTEHDCWGRTEIKDAVAMAAYTMDSHNTQRIVVNGMVKNEGNVEVGGFRPYPISYRAIIPKRNECSNLLVPVCLSSSHIAFGSIRMEPVFMVLGQSAAVAAVMAIDDDLPIQDVDVAALQKRIAEDPYLNGGLREFLADDTDQGVTEMSGSWKSVFFKEVSYFSSTMIAEDQNAKARINLNGAGNGKYRLYFYCPGIREMKEAGNYEFEITDTKGKRLTTARPAGFAGDWMPVGIVELDGEKECNVVVKAGEGTAALVFDAVMFLPEDLLSF